MKPEESNKDTKVEFSNKYDNNNPYYTDEKEWEIKNNKEVVNERLKEIDKKDIQYIEKQANYWDKTLIDKDLLNKLHDFDFWKEWKNNES
jgi:hypothetical protein